MEKNIIPYNKPSRIRFTVEIHQYEREVRGGYIKIDRAIIVLKSLTNGKSMIHPFTDFLWQNYRGLRIKSQIDYGRMLTTFFNDILDRPKKYKIDNFTELKYYHASEFINYYCANLSRETAKRYMYVISNFYYFLAKRELLDMCSLDDFKIIRNINKRGIVTENIIAPFFKEIELPIQKARTKNEHDMQPEFQGILLEVAFEEVNIIAFGVALQMFAGLRMGEIVNLTYGAIRTVGINGRYGLVINVKDRDLRPELKNNAGKGYSKRFRYQQGLSPFGIIEILLSKHRKKYRVKDGSDAIFVNSDGKAMSYESYRYYFGKLKRNFLDRLKESKNPIIKTQGIILESKRWFSHIGRGIFSNNLIEIVDNITEFQVKRGDLNIESGKVYIGDSRRLGLKFEENTEEVYLNLVNKFKKEE